ncbi:hypothetical protein K438DRAFT_2021501 [Mycena galopus ATCC 62051]|nr:hypothetical protein K438DRAFT_2021501 [Mycena galopus ATCC 62051]
MTLGTRARFSAFFLPFFYVGVCFSFVHIPRQMSGSSSCPRGRMSLKKIPRWLLAVVSPPHRLPRLSIAFRLSVMCKDFLS